jgi:uncharacterized protein with FMN-binding domain
MRRIVIATGTTASAVALLLTYPTSTNRSVGTTGLGALGTATSAQSAAPTAGGTTAAAPAAGGTTAAAPAAGASGTVNGTFKGSTAQTQYGPVQVEIVVQNSKIISANAIKYPTGNQRDVMISNYAVPTLNAEAVQAQSAKISMVSGATYTSDGYLQSLQSAIDQAHLR